MRFIIFSYLQKKEYQTGQTHVNDVRIFHWQIGRVDVNTSQQKMKAFALGGIVGRDKTWLCKNYLRQDPILCLFILHVSKQISLTTTENNAAWAASLALAKIIHNPQKSVQYKKGLTVVENWVAASSESCSSGFQRVCLLILFFLFLSRFLFSPPPLARHSNQWLSTGGVLVDFFPWSGNSNIYHNTFISSKNNMK